MLIDFYGGDYLITCSVNQCWRFCVFVILEASLLLNCHPDKGRAVENVLSSVNKVTLVSEGALPLHILNISHKIRVMHKE